ncbi:MAG: hypothetical protein ABSH40_03265 [Bryobacteraceae bacterium]|jgi:hypothetical protein
MKKMLFVCLMVGALFAAIEKPAIEGNWEGESNGLKAVAITVHENKGQMEGSVIFYVMRNDDGQSKRIVGQDERKMLETHWDGKTLRFAVGAPDFEPGAPGVRFAMTITGDKKAELKRLAEDGQTLALVRVE